MSYATLSLRCIVRLTGRAVKPKKAKIIANMYLKTVPTLTTLLQKRAREVRDAILRSTKSAWASMVTS